jgi:putative ABC transport system substrate-binding protein
VTYNAQGNKTLMRGEIEEIAEKGYPLVFTIGTLASQMTTEVFTKKNMNTPIVFTSVNDPVGCHIVRSEQTPGGHVTGIKELLDFQKELELALSFKPNIHRILLVWNPMEPSLAKDVQEIDAHLSKKGIKLLTVEIFQTNECMAKVSPLVAKSDAMLVLKDNIVVSGLDTLIKLCNLHRIPLIASDLDSPDRGAALGVGVREVDFGIEGAKKALQILDQRVPAGDIPVTPVSPITYKINREAAISQGIEAAFLNIEAPSDLLRN